MHVGKTLYILPFSPTRGKSPYSRCARSSSPLAGERYAGAISKTLLQPLSPSSARRISAMPIFMKEHKRAHDALGIAGGLLSQACVACLAGGWSCWLWLWLLWPLLMASTLIRPRGWLGRLLQGRGCTVAEILCYVTVIGSASLAIATMTACP